MKVFINDCFQSSSVNKKYFHIVFELGNGEYFGVNVEKENPENINKFQGDEFKYRSHVRGCKPGVIFDSGNEFNREFFTKNLGKMPFEKEFFDKAVNYLNQAFRYYQYQKVKRTGESMSTEDKARVYEIIDFLVKGNFFEGCKDETQLEEIIPIDLTGMDYKEATEIVRLCFEHAPNICEYNGKCYCLRKIDDDFKLHEVKKAGVSKEYIKIKSDSEYVDTKPEKEYKKKQMAICLNDELLCNFVKNKMYEFLRKDGKFFLLKDEFGENVNVFASGFQLVEVFEELEALETI